MLNPEQQQLLDQLTASLSPEQRLWVSGYLSASAGGVGAPQPQTSNVSLALFYATETGNTKAVAQQLEKQARARGIKTKLTPLNRVKPKDLEAVGNPAVFLSSTHGEGDPPDLAVRFFEACKEAGTLALSKLEYAVLGLGDSSYAEFCGAAVDLETILKNGGGKSFHETRLLDVDYHDHIPAWIEAVLAAIPGVEAAGSAPPAFAPAATPVSSKGFNRLSTVKGVIKEHINLNDRGSNKETYHIEIAFDEPLPYQPGDAAGIIVPQEEGVEQLTPRLYSIASSALAYPNALHLTVALAKHVNADGSEGFGITSHYLSQLKADDEVEFYIQRNQRFKLPEDGRDIIMIGPGTGVAPFRAFMQERIERGSAGRNWLFFGDQYQHVDFLYQVEWQEWLESGDLTRLDVAFSRDQGHKIYVQHRMWEQAEELMNWLDGGASLYVCGAKSPMSEDVEATLLEIAAKRHADPRDWLDGLSEADRYVKDVY